MKKLFINFFFQRACNLCETNSAIKTFKINKRLTLKQLIKKRNDILTHKLVYLYIDEVEKKFFKTIK